MSQSAPGVDNPTGSHKPAGRPPLEQNRDREKWGVQMQPELILNVRKLALDRRCSPYDILEEAVSAYFRNLAKR